MEKLIKKYNYKDVVELGEFLLNYRDTLDYQYLFSSKEWILSFLEVYKPKDNFLILLENSHNYFSLSVVDNKLVFIGDPFNDFNGVFISDSHDQYDFKEVIWYFSDLGYKMKLTNLTENNLIKELTYLGDVEDGVMGLKITDKQKNGDYDQYVSKRIKKMYNKSSKDLLFHRAFGAGLENNPFILNHLLSTRQSKLISKKKEEYNLSFEDRFNKFITKLVSFASIWKNVFIDYCVHKNTGAIMASTLNFVKDKTTICYLRAHDRSSSAISYGLILDYWSNNRNFHEGVEVIDLTRGNESYKYRLGAVEYKLKNFVII